MYAKARRSVVSACAIPAGTRCTREMLTVKRPGLRHQAQVHRDARRPRRRRRHRRGRGPDLGDALRTRRSWRSTRGRVRDSGIGGGSKRWRRRSARSSATSAHRTRRDDAHAGARSSCSIPTSCVPTIERPCKAQVVVAVDDLERDLAVDVVVDPSPGADARRHARGGRRARGRAVRARAAAATDGAGRCDRRSGDARARHDRCGRRRGHRRATRGGRCAPRCPTSRSASSSGRGVSPMCPTAWSRCTRPTVSPTSWRPLRSS